MTARHGNGGSALRQDQTWNLLIASKDLRTLIYLKNIFGVGELSFETQVLRPERFAWSTAREMINRHYGLPGWCLRTSASCQSRRSRLFVARMAELRQGLIEEIGQ